MHGWLGNICVEAFGNLQDDVVILGRHINFIILEEKKKEWGPIELEFQSDHTNNPHYTNSSIVIPELSS